MILVWHLYALFVMFFLFIGLVTALVNFFTFRSFDQYPPAKEYPFVSVLVPARNEAYNIAACVASLLAQDYPDFEVIVLNDNSTDDTPRILEQLARSDNRLRIIQGAPLPDDWLGKHWACHQLYLAAAGGLLLFTDADTRHTPDMLRASVSALYAENADLVTAFPREEMGTWGERLLVPIIGWGILTFIPIRLVQKMRWSPISISIGQFMLFRRPAYEMVGGFVAVRTEVIDDVCMGRRLITSGGEWRLLDGTRHVSCRMYRGFGEALGGFSRSLFAVFDYRILPYILGWLFVGAAFLGPVGGLISYLLRVRLPAPPVEYPIISVAFSIIIWILASQRFRFSVYLVLLYPIALALFIFVAANSFIQVLNGSATWKDRALDQAANIRWL